MNRTELITATALVLFAAFLLGWFTCWLIGRLTRPAQADLDHLARRLAEAERDRDRALASLDHRETDLAARLAAAETDLELTRDDLRDSRTEIEELRDYIDRRLGRR